MGVKDALAAFDSLGGEPAEEDVHYPGSKKVRRAVAKPPDPWDSLPHLDLPYKGETRRFYTVGVLAEKLGRQPQAIRKWERLGYLPMTRYRTNSRRVNGQKRLYTREQIEGIVRIATEEGVIGGETNRNVSATEFPAKVAKLFKSLS